MKRLLATILAMVIAMSLVLTVSAEEDVLRPLDISGVTVDKENGRYMANVTDLETIYSTGSFTLEIYMADTYSVSDFNNLREGSRIEVAGAVVTVDQIKSLGDGSCELYTKEDFDGYIVFKKDTDDTCSVTVNDWTPCRYLTSEKIMMPLPYRFSFIWAGGDEDASVYDGDAFAKLADSGELTGELNQYNTLVQFGGGQLEMIGHTDYPYGPDEGWVPVENAGTENTEDTTVKADTEPVTTEDTDTGADTAAAAPEFMKPAIFTARFDATMAALAEQFTDVLGEDGVNTIKSDYSFTETDPQGMFLYYGTKGWGIEAGFLYLDAESATENNAAVYMNLNIKNDVPEIPAFLATYTLQLMVSYDFQGQINDDDLTTWFDNADISTPFTLPGYTLSVIPGDEYTQYAFIPTENPLTQTAGE